MSCGHHLHLEQDVSNLGRPTTFKVVFFHKFAMSPMSDVCNVNVLHVSDDVCLILSQYSSVISLMCVVFLYL